MSTTTVSNDMNYDDPRLDAVDEKYDTKISESDELYQDMIDKHDTLIGSQIADWETWKTNQTNLQNEQTDFTIQQIEEQKEQAEKDYIKEQSGSYKDWQKQSDKYGVNAEQMASSGMKGSGYSESSQVAMYNQYQSRVTTAREVHNRSILTYDNNIKEARLQNSSILAEIAYNALVAQNELALTGLQYKNGLILEKANRKLELESMRDKEWYEILKQMNAENSNSTTDSDGEDDGTTLPIKPDLDTDTNADTTDGDAGRDIPVDYNSMLALGVGKLTEPELAELVSQDYVIMTEENGRYVFRWSATKEAQKRKQQLENRYKDQVERNIKTTIDELNGIYEVDTPYYRGKKNVDGYVYGTFKNGYQPKGVGVHGKLKDSGKTITFTTTTLTGEEKTVTQKVWKAEDGTKWYWDGRYNKYIEYKK